MRKIRPCDITDKYSRHLMNLYFLSKYVFHFSDPEEMVYEYSNFIVRDVLEKARRVDDVEIEYSFLQHRDLYVSDFFETTPDTLCGSSSKKKRSKAVERRMA